MSPEAKRTLDYLASIPRYANTVVRRKVAQELILDSDGYLFSGGSRWFIKAKNAGGGLVKLTCEEG